MKAAQEAFPKGCAHDRLLGAALRTLERIGIGREHVSVGGGAPLSWRWRHRPPGALALFLAPAEAGRALRGDRGRAHALSVLEEEGAMEPFVQSGWISWRLPEGTVGAFADPGPPVPGHPQGEDRRHGVQMDSTAMALQRKVRARMVSLGMVAPQDALDMLAAERREPEALGKALERVRGSLFAAEAELLARISETRGDGEAPLWRETARMLRGDPPKDPDAPLPKARIQCPGTFRDPDGEDILPARMFRSPPLRERAALSPESFMGTMRKCMAGHPLRPEPEEVSRWLRRRGEGDPRKEGYLHDWLATLNGMEAARLRQSCGASVLDIARTALRAGGRGWGTQFRTWLNRYALRAQGRPGEDRKGYGLLDMQRAVF